MDKSRTAHPGCASSGTAVPSCGPAVQPRKKLPRNCPINRQFAEGIRGSSFPLDGCVSGVRASPFNMCFEVTTSRLYVVGLRDCRKASRANVTVMRRRSGCSPSNSDVERGGRKGLTTQWSRPRQWQLGGRRASSRARRLTAGVRGARRPRGWSPSGGPRDGATSLQTPRPLAASRGPPWCRPGLRRAPRRGSHSPEPGTGADRAQRRSVAGAGCVRRGGSLPALGVKRAKMQYMYALDPASESVVPLLHHIRAIWSQENAVYPCFCRVPGLG